MILTTASCRPNFSVSMMFSLAYFIALFLLVSFPVSESVSGPHITDVNLLLPPHMTYPVEYRLQGTDGCFSWSWDHHDILSLQPEFNDSSRCSTSARLKSIAPYGGRKETAVYAADLRTGIVIRCKVFIDKISRIQIFHNSIKLDLDGLATLRARAFDSQENVFSSLVGLQFSWRLIPESDGGIHHLVHVPLKDSPLSDCGGFCGDLDTQIKLEDSGVFSDLYAVRGTEIGHEIVTVNLIEPQFEHMTDKIVLTVAEAMSIDPPSPVFVIIGATVHYSLKVIRQHTPQAIDLPSTYHRWSVLNSSVAVVDYMMGVAQSLNLGTTTITVEDTRVVGHVQMSSLHVVRPDTLCLYKLPVTAFGDPIEGIEVTPSTNRWYVVAGQQYVIYVKVFTRGPGGQEIYITESDDVMLQYDESAYWITTSSPVNIAVKHGWQRSRILKATSQGLGRLTASLTYPSGHPEKIEVLQVAQEVMVCDHVKFSMPKSNGSSQIIHLPWAPGVHQELELTATGGCVKTSNGYKWYSSDAATVFVSASGVVQAKRPGLATIKVVSTFDSMNYDEVVIQVSVPSSMVMLPNFAVEAVVGTYLQAAVTMKASNGSYFYRCDSFSSYIRWTAGSESFKIFNKTTEASTLNTLPNIEEYHLHYGPPCAWTFIYAFSAGRALLHATLSKELQSFDHPSDGPKVLKASSIIASYHPLVVRQAGNGNQFGGYVVDLPTADVAIQLKNLDDLYLVPHTEMDVKLIGGPDRWDQGVDFIEDVNIFDEEHRPLHDGVLVDRTFSSGGLYRISCQTLGIYSLVFSRGNLVGDDHPLPAIEKVELSLTCSFPSSITLIANEPVNTPELVRSAAQADRSPGRIRATPITVANGCTIRTAAVSLHSSGKAFANSSSLSLKWELSSCDGLAYWDANVLERSSSSWERFLVLKNASGLCNVRATVSGFSATMTGHLYKRASSLLEKSEHILTDAIRLQLVSSMRIVPESILLFFSPDAKVSLSITGGTCFLDAVVNDTQVVEVIQLPSSLQCSHLMLGLKGLGTAVVTVHDIGLAPPITASAVVQVADMDWIKIISQEEISLMEGSLLSIDILAGVRDGSVFDSSQYVYMNVHVHIEDPILEFDSTDASSTGNTYISEPRFTIRAKKLGVTTLYVSAKQRSGHEVLSQPIKVEVYAPPRIHPDDIFLVPGASYGLTLKGGPTIGVFVEYASMDDGTAAIDRSSGRLLAMSPGNTTVRATVYGKGNIVICQAHGSIKVGIPSSMILNLQSEQLSVGREMPIFPSLVEGNLFSFYELCQNYEWTVEDEQVLSFQSVKHLHEVPFSGAKETKALTHFDGKDLGFINTVYGRSAGRTNVAVSFSCDFISGTYSLSRSYNASVSLWVVSDPPLSLGVPITWVLPPFYTTSDVLPSSSDVHNKWQSSSRKGTIVYSLLRSCGGKNEEMQQDVISINGGRITTGDSDNLSCIQAKDRISGRTEIASCVRVAEVAQIRLTTKEFPFHVADLAVGAELELLINYCDSLGNPFYEAYDVVQIDAVTNYPEVVSINGTRDGFAKLHLKAMHQGRALVRITMNNNPQKSDYIMISVGAHLYPQNPVLHVGRYLNFTVGGLDGLVSGRWLSANGSVLNIDKLSGEAYAMAEGATQVTFKGSSLKLQTTITVLRVDDVLVDSPAETLTNVPLPTKGYNFSISFSDPSGNKFEAIGSSKGVLYDCMVDPPFVGYTKPWRDHDTGNSYCLFFPFSPKHLARLLSKSKVTRPDISVTISASLREAGGATGSSSALFIGGFSVLEMDKNLMQLNLTPESNSSIITVVGNTDVVIHWKEMDRMMVIPTRKYGSGLGGKAEYEVKALRAERFTDKVIITLLATGQRAEVDVSYDPGVIPSSSTSSTTFWGILLACLLLFIVTVIIFIWFLGSPVMSTPSTPATTNITGPVTPDRGTPPPGHNIQHSPRTPQPYIEYMRRTIDETPYYKRDGRRKINLQNTY